MRERVDEEPVPGQGKMMCNGGIPGVDDEQAEECMYAEDGWPRMDGRGWMIERRTVTEGKASPGAARHRIGQGRMAARDADDRSSLRRIVGGGSG